MTIQPNPCLDPCQFQYDTATGKSSLRLDPAGGISCDGDGLKVAAPAAATFKQHSTQSQGAVVTTGSIAAGILAPGSGPCTTALAVPGVGDTTLAHSSIVTISGHMDADLFEGGSDGRAKMAMAASVDGGVTWSEIYGVKFWKSGSATAYQSWNVDAIWQVPDGYALTPRFFIAYTTEAGTGAAAIYAASITARMQVHRLFDGPY